jgi:hypothetical protein
MYSIAHRCGADAVNRQTTAEKQKATPRFVCTVSLIIRILFLSPMAVIMLFTRFERFEIDPKLLELVNANDGDQYNSNVGSGQRGKSK